jgi:hypothetical protein
MQQGGLKAYATFCHYDCRGLKEGGDISTNPTCVYLRVSGQLLRDCQYSNICFIVIAE